MVCKRVTSVLLAGALALGLGMFTSTAWAEDKCVPSDSNRSETCLVAKNTDSVPKTPKAGKISMAGVSAEIAAIMTAVVVGLLTSVVSFAYLIRRR